MNFMEEIQKLTEEFNAKIEELAKHIKEQEEEANDKMPKGEIWKPAEDEEFYWIDECSAVYTDVNGDWCVNGNAYATKEKAEFEANREKYTRLFRQYVEQHSEPLDWGDNEQEKWFVCFNYNDKVIGFDWEYLNKSAGCIYASSKEVLQEAIEFVGWSNFEKYVLEVEEEECVK